MPAVQQPTQHLFVSNRNITIRSTLGHCITFEKGVATHVPKALHALVLEKGILPCDPKGKEVDLETAQNLVVDTTPIVKAPDDPDERLDAIKKVCRDIGMRNVAADFNAGGTPRDESVSLALGWKVDKREVRQAWAVVKLEIMAASGAVVGKQQE